MFVLNLDCGKSLTIDNGQANFTNVLTTPGNSVPVICDLGYKLTGGTEIECQENGLWSQTVSCEIVGKETLILIIFYTRSISSWRYPRPYASATAMILAQSYSDLRDF